MKKLSRILSFLLVLCMIFSLLPSVYAGDVTQISAGKTVILHSNDVHGEVLGYAYIAALKTKLEAAGADVILADAGDYSQGETAVSLSKGANAVELMNAAGYDVVGLGNHEFDYGFPQLQENMKNADFTVLCSDVLDAEGAPIFEANTIVEKGGVKIGFFGLETPETQTKANPALIKGLTFLTDSTDTTIWQNAQAQIDALKADGADLVVCLSHLGVDASSEPYRSYDLYKEVTGLDFIIDAHSHTVMEKGENDEPIQSTGTKFANIGVIVIDNATKKIEENYLVKTGEDGFNDKDETVLAKAQAIIDAINAEYGQKFATSEVELNGAKEPGNRTEETNNGDLITDAMVWCLTEKYPGSITEVDAENVVAVTNGGGIRAAVKVGDVTKNDIFTVLPFGNTVAVVYVTGAELLEALEASTYCTPISLGGFPQVAGIKFTVDADKAYDKNDETYPGSTYYGPKTIQRVTIDEINGKPFDAEAKYAVITNNFVAGGGDTYYAFAAATSQFDTGYTLDSVVIDYITEKLGGVITEADYGTTQGRINITEAADFEFLVTSDLHGQIFATDYTVDVTQSGTYKRGLTRVASYIKEQRTEYGDNLYVVDMGDTIQGAPLTYYYAFNKPEADDPAIKAFRTIGYDMWVVGNHEFNYGLNILGRQLDYATSASTETEKQITVCLANYLDATTNSDESKDWATWRGYDPYVIKDFDGVKVAIIGFGNPNIPTWDIPANWEGIYFADIIETYKKYEPEMKEKADMIVVVAHSGVNSDVKSDFIEKLIEQTDSIAFAFSGHEHNNKDWTFKNAKGEDVHVLQPFTKARSIAQVKVSYDIKTGKATVTPAIVDMENYKLDEELVQVLQPYEDATWNEYMLQKIGEASADFTAQELGTKPSAFMDLVNTVQLWGAYDNTGENTPDDQTDDKPAQLSISAPLTSGDNANIIDKGDIYLGDMFKLYRFENWFYQITMKGEEVHQWLEFAATKIKVVDGKPTVNTGDLTYYDVIYGEGFSYVIDYTKPEGERIVSMTYNGKEVTADQTFTVVVNNYRYNGGGHYIEWLNAHGCEFKENDPDRIIYSTQFDMIQGEDKGQARNLLTDYIRNEKTITPTITSTWKLEPTTIALVPDSNNMFKYGHLDLDISTEEFLKLFDYGDIVTVTFNGKSYDFPVCSNYDDVDTHALLIRAATGKNVVTLAINYGQIGVEAGIIEKAPEGSETKYQLAEGVTFPIYATVTMKEAGGYKDELSVRQLNRTNNREEYPELTDEQFANFRNIATTGMGKDILYRSSSPINPELGRNTYADKAAEAAGIKTFVNLADTETEAKGYEGFGESYYAKQNVIFLGLPVAFTTPEFKNGLAEGFRYMTQHEGPYLVHCTEGKDRAGLTSAILECFMGASAEEVADDYLTTFRNYYNVVDGKQIALTEAQETYLRNAILKNLCLIFDMEDVSKADLKAEATAYLKEIGLTDAEVEKLHENLRGTEPIEKEIVVPSTEREGGAIHTYITVPAAYTADGSYPLAVMLHGHGGNHNEWGGYDTISTGLAEKGFVVVTMDFPGCGNSTESFRLNTMTNMKADVVDVIDYVTTNYAIDETRVGGFGYSIGGRVILEMLAEEMYDFTTVELVAPAEDTTDLKDLFGGAENWDKLKAEAEANGFANFHTIYGQDQELSKEWFADLEKYMDGLAEKAAEKYDGNSLVIWATDDAAVRPKVSQAVATVLGSATVNTYTDGHSYSFYGSDPYTIATTNNSCINYFVNELTVEHTGITGYVQSIAKYGNLELTIPGAELEKAGFAFGDILKITVDGKVFDVPYGSDYSDVDQGSVVLRNSNGHLTLAINMGNFATANGFATKKTNEDKSFEWYYADGVSMPLVVGIEMGEKGGYYDQWLIHQLKRTNNREDYADLTDEQFANFRNIATTGMGKNILYRSSSPINPEIGRNTYADKAAEAAGVKTFVNLANDKATAEAYPGYADTYYSKQNIVFLNLGVDFTEQSFKNGLADGLRYMTQHEGPYLVHCTEGKDRAGFVSALLECFMGATYDEVIADYMTTYFNYYGVEVGSEKYTAIANSNIIKSLKTAFGVEDLTTADLKAEAVAYLKEIGLTDAEIEKLHENLSNAEESFVNPFKDVSEKAWFYSYVTKMAEKGIINGMTATTFEPEGSLTRGQWATLLYRVAGEPEVKELSKFKDVPKDSYYAKAIAWAQAEGVVMGVTAELFEPESLVTREQMVTMLYRFSKATEAKGDLTGFKDADKISGYAVEAMKWAVGEGYINGMTATTLEPQAHSTRAQAAKVLCLFIEE